MKPFFKFGVPFILAVTGLIEGTSWSLHLLNQPSDLAVVGGATLGAVTMLLFGEFANWFVRSITKSL